MATKQDFGFLVEIPWDPNWLEIAAEEQDEQDEEEDVLYPDTRKNDLGHTLQALLYIRFGGNIDAMALKADQLFHTMSKPPKWAKQIFMLHQFKWRKTTG